jgi:hypothetical protein
VPVRQFDTDGQARARDAAAGRGRRFAAWLVIGWSAFWLNSTVLACCAELTPEAASGGEAVIAALPAANPNYRHHNHPLPSTCAELVASTVAAAYAAPVSTDRPDSRVAKATSSIRGPVVAAAATAVLRVSSIHPPHAPLYLRTARLLI